MAEIAKLNGTGFEDITKVCDVEVTNIAKILGLDVAGSSSGSSDDPIEMLQFNSVNLGNDGTYSGSLDVPASAENAIVFLINNAGENSGGQGTLSIGGINGSCLVEAIGDYGSNTRIFNVDVSSLSGSKNFIVTMDTASESDYAALVYFISNANPNIGEWSYSATRSNSSILPAQTPLSVGVSEAISIGCAIRRKEVAEITLSGLESLTHQTAIQESSNPNTTYALYARSTYTTEAVDGNKDITYSSDYDDRNAVAAIWIPKY
jgi:hypothetical protein